MCDPVTLGSAAVGAAGSLISSNEAQSSARAQADARNRATMAEVERQKAYGDQSRGEFDKSMTAFAPGAQDTSRAAATSGIGDILTGQAPTAAQVGGITTANAPAVVGATETARLGDVFKRAAQNNTNLATLKGYDQNQFNTNLQIGQQGRNIDTIGDFSKVSSGVSKTEQDAAFNNAKKPSSGIGELLSFAGNVGANQAGKGNIRLPAFTGSMAPATIGNAGIGAIY